MTKARIQHCLKKLGVNLGYFNEDRVFPRTLTNIDSVLFLYDNHCCLIWKSEGVSFDQAIKKIKDNFKIVDNFITKENVKSHFKYEIIPKKNESHLTNFITYDLETQILMIALDLMYFVLID